MSLLIIAAGSPSTLFAVAGYCQANGITANNLREGSVHIVFTQAFQVGVDPRSGKPSEALAAVQAAGLEDEVVLIGLPVNNRDPKMTTDFVRAVGPRLVGIYDEHEPERWEALREELSLSAELFHTPGKGEGHLSAASIVGVNPAMQTLWVTAGDWADNRQLEVDVDAKALATDIDNAIKARITDNAFRITVIRHLLGDTEASEAFKARLAEGKAIEEATTAALEAAELCGKVLVIRHSAERRINPVAAMMVGYRRAAFVAVVGPKAGEGDVVEMGCNDRHPTLGKTNLLQIFSAAGLTAGGISAKATVHGAENLDRMVEALNAL